MKSWRVWFLGLCLLVAALHGYGCSADERPALANDAGIADGGGDGTLDGTATGDGSGQTDAAGDADASEPTYAIKGIVTGLVGSGLALSLANEDISIPASDAGVVAFAFNTRLPQGASYSVTIKTQPTSPLQICAVTGGSGVVGGSDVNDVEVTCETVRFSVGGHTLGLLGSGLVLRNNGADDLAIDRSDAGADAGADAGDAAVSTPIPFTFATKIESGAPFLVTVATQPTVPSQNCTVSGGQGNVVSGDVTTVTVNCTTNTFTIGGTIEGLVGTGLKLTNNDGDEISVNNNGTFSFPVAVLSGEKYAVAVSAQPTNPWQTCTVTGGTGSGTVGSGNVDTVKVSCVTNTYSVGGSVSGLAGTGLKLKNGNAEITIATNGPFSFPIKLPSGTDYDVSVSADPINPWQTCTIQSGGTGKLAGSDAKDVVVTCTTRSFTVGGQVIGAIGNGLRISNTRGDAGDAGVEELVIADAGPFTFDAAVPSGQTYNVQISTRPTFAGCNVSNGSAVMAGANVTNVAVACASGTVVGGTSLSNTNALPADTLLARPVTIASASTAHTIGGFFVNAGCSVRFALYADAAGSPGALLGNTGEITTGSSGASEGALTSPVTLAPGTYWVALLSLTTCNGYFAPTGGPGYTARPNVSYSGPFPNPFGTGGGGPAGFDVAMYVRVLP